MISSSMASNIGGLNIFFEIVISAIVGIYLLQNFKFSLMQSINEARTGQITQEEFIKTNVAKAIGAILLIIPGFFTDFIGIALQFGFLTMLLTKIFQFKSINTENYTNPSDPRNSTHFTHSQQNLNNTNYKGSNDEIIDVEIIDNNSPTK